MNIMKLLTLSASALLVSACVSEDANRASRSTVPIEFYIDVALDKVDASNMHRAKSSEYACVSIDGYDFDGGYVMYLQEDVRVPGGETVDFLHGFYLNYDRDGDLIYVEGYSGAFEHLEDNAFVTAGYRYIPENFDFLRNPNATARSKAVPIDRYMLFYKSEIGYPKGMVVTMEFLDRGVTVLGCERLGGRPKWMEIFEEAIEDSIKNYKQERMDFS